MKGLYPNPFREHATQYAAIFDYARHVPSLSLLGGEIR